MFWTDYNQAVERLNGCVVNYDGKPVYLDDFYPEEGGKGVTCRALFLASDKSTRKRIELSDPKWNNFRDLPKLGWFNYITDRIQPVFLDRKAVNTRSHGLCASNVIVCNVTPRGVEKSKYDHFTEYLKNTGYHETKDSEEAFPKLSEILMALDENPGGVAFSRKFCVIVTEEGMKWLFRKDKRIGFFTGTDSLNLFPKNGFYKEELQACPAFDINNIKEF